MKVSKAFFNDFPELGIDQPRRSMSETQNTLETQALSQPRGVSVFMQNLSSELGRHTHDTLTVQDIEGAIKRTIDTYVLASAQDRQNDELRNENRNSFVKGLQASLESIFPESDRGMLASFASACSTYYQNASRIDEKTAKNWSNAISKNPLPVAR